MCWTVSGLQAGLNDTNFDHSPLMQSHLIASRPGIINVALYYCPITLKMDLKNFALALLYGA